MNSNPGQRRSAPTAHVPCLNRRYETERAPSDTATRPSAPRGSGSLLDEVAAFKAQMSMAERLRTAKDELIHLEMDLEFKTLEVKRCEALLKEKTIRTRQAMLEREKFKEECEELRETCRAAELRIAELTERNQSAYTTFESLKKEMATCYELGEQLLEEQNLGKETLDLLPSSMDKIKKDLTDNVFKLSAQIRAMKSQIDELTEDLRDCREQLEEKSQLCEAAHSSILSLEEQVELCKAENAKCQSKVQFVAEEHSIVLEQMKSLERELREEKEEKNLLVAHLHALASNTCGLSDLEGESTQALLEAINAAVGKLSEDCHSLRESERLAREKAEALSAEKDALAAENAGMVQKLLDLGELKIAKRKLEIELSVQQKAVSDMRAGIRAKLSRFRGMVNKMKQQDAVLSSVLANQFAMKPHLLECGRKIHAAKDCVSVVRSVVAQLIDGKAVQDCNVQRLSAECASMQADNAALKAEMDSLCEAITNFEQLAEGSTEELERAKEEMESLKESLAEARAQVVPVEERERADQLLLERETQISRLEKDLKEMERKIAILIEEKTADADVVEAMRVANEELKCQVLKLSGQLVQEQERRDGMVNCDVQTECLPRADRDMQTENNMKVDCNMQTECLPRSDCDMQTENVAKGDCDIQTENTVKVDAEAQTAGGATDDVPSKVGSEVQVTDAFDAAILAKLAASQLNGKKQSMCVRRLEFEKRALENSCKEKDSKLVDAQKTSSNYEKQVETLLKEKNKKEQEKDELIKKVNLLEAVATSQDQHMEQKSLELAELVTENERLKAELARLQERVRGLGSEEAGNAGAAVKRPCYTAAEDKKDPKGVGAAGSARGQAAPQIVTGAQHKSAPMHAPMPAPMSTPKPAAHLSSTPELLFTPDGSPVSPGPGRPLIIHVSKLTVPPTGHPAVSDESSTDDSLAKLVRTIEARASTAAWTASSAPAGTDTRMAAGLDLCRVGVERVVPEQVHIARKPVEKRSKSKEKKAAAQVVESTSASKRSRGQGKKDAPLSTSVTLAAPPEDAADAPALPSKKRKFFKSKDYDPEEMFKMSFI